MNPTLLPGLGTLAALFVSAACASTHSDSPGGHTHRRTTTVVLTDRQLLPADGLRIPRYSTLVCRNRTSAPVDIHIGSVACGTCETVFGFEPDGDGAQAMQIAPGAIATLCFHDIGSFPISVHTGSGDQRNTIVVEEAR